VSIDDAIQSARVRLLKHSRTPMPVNVAGGCEVLADRLLLEQALYNVLDNALRYGNGLAGISILSQLEGDMCRIEIADQGPGIAQDQLPNAFGKFHLIRHGKAQGTGLGLSIVRGFIEAMGGTAEAQVRADGASGLVIVVNLPRAH
jgi:two-component system, OmpR family, sensor histidine kinase KdpD